MPKMTLFGLCLIRTTAVSMVALMAAWMVFLGQASAAPRGSEQWLICEMGGTVIIDDEENGCCTDEDQDGYIDTCWICDEDGENCLEEELGEDLRAQQPGAGGLSISPGQAAPYGTATPPMLQRQSD